MVRVIEKVKIVGVDCPSCIYGIEKRVFNVEGILSFKADYVSGEAIVEYDNDLTSLNDVVKAIRDAGYDVEKDHLEFYVDIEDEEIYPIESKVKKIPGIIDCRVSPVSKLMRILYNPYTLSRKEIKEYLKDLKIGFTEEVGKKLRLEVSVNIQKYLRFTAFTLALFAIIYHNIGYLTKLTLPLWNYRDLLLFSIATVVILLNIDIILKGLKSLIRLSPSMESLITLSSLSSYIFSIAIVIGFLRNSETFFEASAGVLGFIGLGKYIESRLRMKVAKEMEKLGGVISGRVRVVKDHSLEEVDVEKVVPGDVVEFKSGEKILVDGVVIDGWGYVDESLFTGEVIPRFKSGEKRDPVFAGTLLISGYIKVRVTRVSKDTVFSHIIEIVKEASFIKPKTQLLADRIVGYMTWVVIILSIITFTYWLIQNEFENAVLFMASVLAVTCPCPLGIAIPMVYAIAIYKLASLGVVIRRGDIFERFLKIDVAVFDKTNTLTIGKPTVGKVIVLNSSEKELMSIVCSAERRSEHPIASAILKYCRDKEYVFNDPDEYVHIPGLGIVAKVGNEEVIVGSERLINEMNADIPENVMSSVIEYRKQGYTVVFIGLNKVLAGLILLKDSIREDSVEVIEFLKMRNIRTVIASGDNFETVKTVAREVKVSEAYAELTPDDKVELVEKFQKNGLNVMFVGDGVNDAGAIGKSFLGIAIGSGSDIAKLAGDIVIMSEKLKDIKKLIIFSEKVRRKSLENLLWAFIYNLTLVPVAMGTLYNFGVTLRPEMAAIAMILSDISVILNSLTLLKSKLS